ncbi:hypothetical protein ACTA71_003135 [Dictyostelium dimigraforme]
MNKLIFTLLLLYVYIFSENTYFTVLGNSIECNCYADSKSTLTSNCGTVATTPCQSISQSILSCDPKYDSLTLNIEAGTYKINQATFGSITNKSITIVNNNKETNDVIIDLSNAIDSFIRIEPSSIYDSSFVSFTGITFQNGNSSSYGAVLFNNGTSIINLVINNCVFTNNIATLGGGSIAVVPLDTNSSDEPSTNSKINVSKSTFSNSTLSKVSGGVFYIYNLNVEFTIDQCSFNNIKNSASGGIIYMRNGLLTMTNTTLNSISSNAAFFLASGSTFKQPQFKFTNVNFTNALGGIGFALTSYQTETYFLNCNFVNNVNTGSIFGMNSGLVTVDGCTFSNNNNQRSLGSTGGAITTVCSELLVKNSLFSNNFALNGGAININSTSLFFDPYTATIFNSQFINNTASISGGAINVYSNKLFITSTTFIENYAIQDDHGPSVYCTNSNINLSNSTFKINETDTVNSFGIDCCPSISYSCSLTDKSKSIKYNCEKNDSDNDDNDDNDDGHHGLTTGQKVGISFAVIGGVFIIIVVAIIVARKLKRDRQYKPIRL